MIWQDIVMATVGIVFSFSLVPQVIHGYKSKTGPIKWQTSVPTFVGIYIVCFVYITLSLYFAAITSFFTGTFWLVLWIQRLIYHKRPPIDKKGQI